MKLSVIAALVIGGLLVSRRVAEAHDVHTTVLELRWDAKSATVDATLRIFADDLSSAARATGLTPWTYVLRHVGVSTSGGAVRLRICGEQRVADALLICLRGAAPEESPSRIRNTLLLERYADQVNIVRITTRAMTILLTKSNPERRVS